MQNIDPVIIGWKEAIILHTSVIVAHLIETKGLDHTEALKVIAELTERDDPEIRHLMEGQFSPSKWTHRHLSDQVEGLDVLVRKEDLDLLLIVCPALVASTVNNPDMRSKPDHHRWVSHERRYIQVWPETGNGDQPIVLTVSRYMEEKFGSALVRLSRNNPAIRFDVYTHGKFEIAFKGGCEFKVTSDQNLK